MAKLAGVPEFMPFVLEADTKPNPGGYPIGGQTRVALPNNHLSYALTWYGLALALLVIYGVSGFRKVS
jgi:surfeit locus 1 family protein